MEVNLNLSSLLSQIEYQPGYKSLLERLARRPTDAEPLRLSLLDAAKPYLIACLRRDLAHQMLVVTPTWQRARQLHEQLVAWLGSEADVLLYPEPDALFYERMPADSASRRDRLSVLARVVSPGDRQTTSIVVASARSLMHRLAPHERFAAEAQEVRRGQEVDINTLLLGWLARGYWPEAMVEEPGAFSRRGGIVDVFPPTRDRPVRLEFFGDEIDTIREFDPETQRSGQAVDSVCVTRAREVVHPEYATILEALGSIDLFALRPEVREQFLRDLERFSQGEVFDGSEFYGAFCCDETLVDYLSTEALVVFDDVDQAQAEAIDLAEQAEQLRGQLVESGELPPSFPRPYWDWSDLKARLHAKNRLHLSWNLDHADKARSGYGAISTSFQAASTYGGRLKHVLDDLVKLRAQGGRAIVVSQQSIRLGELLEEYGVVVAGAEALGSESLPWTTLIHGSLDEGFSLVVPEGSRSFTLLTDREIFGWSKPHRRARSRTTSREAFLADLVAGDFVVHVEHGIARCRGLVHMRDDGTEREFLLLEYAEVDRLYVPTDQLDRVSKYIGVGDHTPTLHRLGSGDWARAKERVRAAVRDIARDLLEIYAAREVKTGRSFSPDSPWQRELEDSFPYVETLDQLTAIAEVKSDMEKPKPMDRLVCGDVGYGKTEVALRAAFKAVMDGQQVVILVPTTVLAQQHLSTFKERMQAFPIHVEVLSRFRTDKEQKQVIEALRDGAVDICIGTHRLLQKDVQVRNLGLVIIDEEQRFGVAHKEHLKQLRKEVDVLTLTATPIPRTLHMALSGIRDLSTMETPPEERLPISTYVTEYDSRLIREAILRELDRGGQVYFVHNRVQSIDYTAQRLAQLVPEALIAVGHGQMPEEQLEKTMLDFAAGKYDVLVCTTIIESGLDIPNVNTLIVNQSDRFGLAQMYQLRGRVGRGAERAYAYFLFSKDKRLAPNAEKRLRAILEASELGAGFKLAMKDLEIRGAGNLLGTEQHGHVAAVGFDLYCRLLAEAVKELQGQKPPAHLQVSLDLPVTAYIPRDYIENEALRLNLYQRLAEATSPEQVDDLASEMRDRFGPLPEPAVHLGRLVQLKTLAAQAGVSKISSDDGEIVVFLPGDGRARLDTLRRQLGPAGKIGHTQLRLYRQFLGNDWIDFLEQVLREMAAVVSPDHTPTQLPQ
ncbi:MAG: transcription-repair coupling factor [Chloroflexi bacterium]|nr:transcription-repair coupling factor [Chloroflexota bacterium]